MVYFRLDNEKGATDELLKKKLGPSPTLISGFTIKDNWFISFRASSAVDTSKDRVYVPLFPVVVTCLLVVVTTGQLSAAMDNETILPFFLFLSFPSKVLRFIVVCQY